MACLEVDLKLQAMQPIRDAVDAFTFGLDNWLNNSIPRITNPLGRSWKQPPTDRILIDNQCAMMSRQTFKELAEYSCSQPSGVYEGKMWKRHDGAFDHEFRRRGGTPIWMLCWYGFSEKPDCVSNNRRTIILTDGEFPIWPE